MMRPSLQALLLLAAASPAAAQETTFAIRGARIIPVAGPELPTGTVLVRDGRIAGVGAELEIPAGVPVLEAEGLVLMPGLVDPCAQLGLRSSGFAAARHSPASADRPAPATLRARDAIHPGAGALRTARAGGLTSAHIMPVGSAGGGQTAAVKLRGRTVEEMWIDPSPRSGGLELADPHATDGPLLGAGSAWAAEVSAALQRAAAYREGWKGHRERLVAGETSAAPPFDPELEILAEVLERRRALHLRLRHPADLRPAMDLAEGFGLELVAHLGAADAPLDWEHALPLAELLVELADRGHGLTVDPAALASDRDATLLARCEAAGVRVALHGGGALRSGHPFLHAGALALRAGASRAGALGALTLEGARCLQLEDRIGSIERGKHADLVLLSGDPLSIYTRVLATWIEGRKVFDRARPGDLRLATGGWAVAEQLPTRDRAPVAPQVSLERRTVERPLEPGPRFAVEAEWLFTAAGPPISKGVVWVEDGRIRAVGAQGEVPLPEGTPIFRAPAVTPGLIDAHADAASLGGAPEGSPAPPRVAVDPRDPRVAARRAQGVTVVQAVPDASAGEPREAGIFRTFGGPAGANVLRPQSALVLDLAAGEGDGAARMERAARIRALLHGALMHGTRLAAAAPEPERDGEDQRTALSRALAGELPVIFVAQRAQDLSSALRIAREFELRCVLSQAAEAYLVAAEIARAAAPVLVGPPAIGPPELGTDNVCFEGAALLRDAGIPIALTSGLGGQRSPALPYATALAAVHGLGVLPALRAVTADAARLLGIEAERGSLERGKAADLVLWDGDPLEPATRVEVVIGDGRVVFDRSAER